jgi:phage terminase large subunit-like protein
VPRIARVAPSGLRPARPVWLSSRIPRDVQPPLVVVPTLGPRYLTWGPVVADFAARRMGLVLTPWERFAVNRALEVDPATMRLRARELLLSVARRNGKTTLVRALLGWLLDVSPLWELGLVTAPTEAQAYGTLWVELAADLAPLGVTAQATGVRAGMGYDDSPRRLFLISGRHDVARGRTFDVVVLDEAQTPGIDGGSWAALEPTTRTRRNGLLVATGTAGTERAELFRALYDRAILAAAKPADDPRFLALVWEATSDDDDGILEANPGVRDGLLELDVLRATRRSLTPGRFAAETLNRWTFGTDYSWAPPGAWDSCADPTSSAPDDGVPLFGVDVTPSWSRASIAAAVLDGERIQLELARDYPTADAAQVDELLDDVRGLLAKYRGSRVGYDASSPVSSAMRDLQLELPGRVVELGGLAFRGACASFLGHVVARTIRHRADPVLDSAARLAARSEDAEAWRFVRRRSAGHIDALVAATIAVHLADRPVTPRPRIR